jgi:dienelactone hydrolase
MRENLTAKILVLALWLAVPHDILHAAPPLSAYGELPGFERAAISPSGNRVAMIATISGQRSLLLTEKGKILRNVALAEIKVRDIEWANDELVLVDYSQTEKLYGFTTDKAEFYRTYVIPVGAGQPAVVFAKQKSIASATFGWHGIREVDGKIYGFFGGVPMAESAGPGGAKEYYFAGGWPALYKVDLSNMKTDRLSIRPTEGTQHDYLIDAKGELAAKMIFVEASGNWRIQNARGDEIARGVNKQGGIRLLGFGKNGASVIFRREDENSQAREFFEVALAGGGVVPFLKDVDVDRVYIHRRTGVLMGYLEAGADPKPRFFDPVLDKKIGKIAKAFPKLRRELADWNPDLSKVLVTTDGNSDSGTWWEVDLNALAASPFGFERPEINTADVGSISTIAYKAADGLEMDGILTLPVGKPPKNLPVILLPHGGPTAHDEPRFDWWAQGLASRGYAVFQPNFRGSTNRDAAFITAGHGEWGRKMQSDISDGLNHLAAQGIVDPKRACIVGASYGGYAALAGVTLQKGLYRCAVSVAGVSDLQLMISTDIRESGSNPVLKRNLDAEIGKGRELKDVSPRRFAAQADAPILLVHGKDDVVVPYRQSTIMADALKDAGKPHELVTLVGEDHWLSKSVTRRRMLETVVAFVEKHNPPQ